MRKFWKRYLILGVLAFLLPFLAWAFVSLKSPKKHSVQMEDTPAVVDVTSVNIQNIPITVQALGSLSAAQVVTISSVGDGRIANIYFKDGQKVGQGMPIVQLDNAESKADYESAVTALELARTQYERSKQLLNTAVSQEQLDQLKATVETKEAETKNKLASLNEKEVLAPFSGVLGAFQVNVGDYIKAGSALVTLVNTSQLRVEYNIPQSLLPQLNQGQLVIVESSAYPNKRFYGTVSFISPTVNQSTRMVAVQC